MTKKLFFTAIALCVGTLANAATITAIDVGQIVKPTVESFGDSAVKTATYDFGNGLGYASLNGGSDFVKLNGIYAVGDGGSVNGTETDWYFATDLASGKTSSTFELSFAGGTKRFGFFGGEFGGGLNSHDDGVFDLQFFDMNNELIGTIGIDNGGLFAPTDVYAFEVDAGAISRVVFQDVGHLALDDVTFEAAAPASSDVPEPASIALLGAGLAGFAATRRKPARK